ncbi:MAG TPA: hypothetical protein VNS58_20940 [Puia sp.]|nr:hypothetical protein [Puia sp.]
MEPIVTFESLVEQIEEILKGDQPAFCKIVDIRRVVDSEIVYKIGIPEMFLSV